MFISLLTQSGNFWIHSRSHQIQTEGKIVPSMTANDSSPFDDSDHNKSVCGGQIRACES
jgi:hypothetical protein